VRLGLVHPMVVLPAAHELVQVRGAEVCRVLLEQPEQLETALEEVLGGGELRADAAGVLVISFCRRNMNIFGTM